MKRRFVAVTAMLGIGVLGALGMSGPASATVTQKQVIPLYIYPNWWVTGNSWDYACANATSAGTGSTMIANPNSGPSASRNTDYAQIIADCHHYGQNVVGYVDTNYGARTEAAVKAEIDAWYSQYGGSNTGVLDRFSDGAALDSHVDGIFLDRMANNSAGATNATDNKTAAVYYHDIYTYILAKDPNHVYDDVIGNPGAPATTSWQLSGSTQAASEIMVFEGPYNNGTSLDFQYYKGHVPAWITGWGAPYDIITLVYDTSTGNTATACTDLKAKNSGQSWVTQETDGNWTNDPQWPSTAAFTADKCS